MTKIAIILFNLGGPDSKKSIRPFLFNFFMDKNIIRLPLPFRFLLAQYISLKRSKKEAGTSYGFLGDQSPLLKNTRAQATALEEMLNQNAHAEYKTFVAMRYWHPLTGDVAREVKYWGADKIILLPLYPQFSTTTTRSSFGVWNEAMRALNYEAPTSTICCDPFNEGFIKASVENIRGVLEQARKDGHQNPRLLFSAHGLPESIITDGDPYQWQCEQSAQKIADELNQELNEKIDWSICYQSRVGRQKWLGPSTEEALRQAAADKKTVIIYPHAFTQEHVETLVEIEIEYRHLAHELGVPGFYRVPTVSTHPAFIAALARMVYDHVGANAVHADGMKRICPENFRRCCMS